MKKIYLSGPMSGKVDHNFPAFRAETARLRRLGYIVVDPSELPEEDPIKEWSWYLKRDIPHLLACDTIALLPDWEESRGACLEHHIAKALGFRVTLSHHIILPFHDRVYP